MQGYKIFEYMEQFQDEQDMSTNLLQCDAAIIDEKDMPSFADFADKIKEMCCCRWAVRS
ncbi:hypothetical protein [Butyrivibrio sp. AE3006]|uniref:hypothetical protein n=1 Tax=Butyrivibrio sp. AE3006 TaxID=1280673 RepID=UPI0012DF7D64|nr:hypothetical protein [Butyrivibrio sp. AE3006]